MRAPSKPELIVAIVYTLLFNYAIDFARHRGWINPFVSVLIYLPLLAWIWGRWVFASGRLDSGATVKPDGKAEVPTGAPAGVLLTPLEAKTVLMDMGGLRDDSWRIDVWEEAVAKLGEGAKALRVDEK